MKSSFTRYTFWQKCVCHQNYLSSLNEVRVLTASVRPGWEPLSCAGTGDLPVPSAWAGFFAAFLSWRLITRRLDFTDLQGLLMFLLNGPSRPLNEGSRGDEKRFRSRPCFLIKPALNVGFPAHGSLGRTVIIQPVQTGWPRDETSKTDED